MCWAMRILLFTKMGYSNSSDNYRTISAQTIIEFIEKNKLDINQKTLITLGCYSECWDEYNKNETISLIKYFLKREIKFNYQLRNK